MPRYFFNIVRGKTVIPDPEGDALAGDAEAMRHASMTAREMLDDRHKYSRRGMERWAFEVMNGAGRHVGTVRFPNPAASKRSANLPKSKSRRR